jgi:hypothetical protein
VVSPASHKVSRASWYSGYQPDSSPFRSTGLSPSLIVLSRTLESHDKSCCWSYNPTSSKDEVVWAPPGSLATTTGISMLISFRRVTEMFQFTHCPPSPPMCSAGGFQTSLWKSCLIRNLGVQRLYAAPPERFAGLRVLLRSLAPRHPPRTLCSLFSILYIMSLIGYVLDFW